MALFGLIVTKLAKDTGCPAEENAVTTFCMKTGVNIVVALSRMDEQHPTQAQTPTRRRMRGVTSINEGASQQQDCHAYAGVGGVPVPDNNKSDDGGVSHRSLCFQPRAA